MMNHTWQRIWIKFTAEPRKFGVMVSLLALGLLLWGRLILLEDVPKTGFANPDDAHDLEEVNGGGVFDPSTGSSKTDTPAILAELPVVYVSTSEALARNMFRAPSALLPQPEQPAPPAPLAPKSDEETPEDPKAQEELRQAAVREEASELRLESLMSGASPIAVVNGTVLRIGDRIGGFVLEDVRVRSAVFSKDGVQVELKMSAPGRNQ